MDAAKQEEFIKSRFLMPTLLDNWQAIKGWYDYLGFTDSISDEDRISEYKYVNEQVRKYVFSHEKELMKLQYNLKALAEKLENYLEKADEVPANDTASVHLRAQFVYRAMRNAWLIDFHRIVMTMIETEEDNDGRDY